MLHFGLFKGKYIVKIYQQKTAKSSKICNSRKIKETLKRKKMALKRNFAVHYLQPSNLIVSYPISIFLFL